MAKLGEDVIEALELLRYPQVKSLVSFNNCPRNLSLIEFSIIVNWLSSELNDMVIVNLPKSITAIKTLTNLSDLDGFKNELNSYLKELKSPLNGCDLNIGFNRLAIIYYLCGELMASRILHVNKPVDGATKNNIRESDTAKELKASMISLGIGKPPANVQSFQLFTKMQDKIIEKLKTSPLASEEPLLFPSGIQLALQDWKTLDKVNYSLFVEYHVRRKTLITRCDCTIGSLKWKAGKKSDPNVSQRIDVSYGKLRAQLDPKPTVSLAHALAARKSHDLNNLKEVTSTTTSTTTTATTTATTITTVSNSTLTTTTNNKPHQQICDIEIPKTKEKTFVGKQQRIFPQKFMIFNGPDRGGRTPKKQSPSSHDSFQHQHQQQQQNHHNHNHNYHHQQRQQLRGSGNQRGGGNANGYQQRKKSSSDPVVQYQSRNQTYTDSGIQFQPIEQPSTDEGREQLNQYDDQSYQQQQQALQYYCDQCFYPPSQPTGQSVDNYVQVYYQQAFFEQSYYEQFYYPQLYYEQPVQQTNHYNNRGGHRGRKSRRGGGGVNNRGGYQVFARGGSGGSGGGRTQSFSWNNQEN